MTEPPALQPHHRRTGIIATLAPSTIGWLYVPLTPSRAAAIAAYELRTGLKAADTAADLLDDVIFNISPSV